MRASPVPTGTGSPSFTRMSSILPSYGLGISESTLSVDTSNSGSSKATSSPTALNHVPIVPSVTDSPVFGIVITKPSPGGDGDWSAFSVVGPSDPPTDGADGSLSDRPPAAATPCAADGSRFGTVAPFPPIRMIAAPTETVSPSCARTSRTTPSYELGTSVSTLSVDISNSGSSNSTSSPTFLKKAPITPSVTDSPNFGRVTTHVSSDISIASRAVSAVKRSAGECNHRLADCLGKAWVSVNQGPDVRRQGVPVDRQIPFVGQLPCPRPDQMQAEYRATARRNDFHQAFGVADDHRPPIPRERVLVHFDVVSGISRLGFGHPHPGDLWMRVGDPGNFAVVHRSGILAKHRLDRDDGLGVGDVCEPRCGHAVTDGVDAGARGLHRRGVHRDEPTAGPLYPRRLQTHPLTDRTTANGDEQLVNLDLLGALR